MTVMGKRNSVPSEKRQQDWRSQLYRYFVLCFEAYHQITEIQLAQLYLQPRGILCWNYWFASSYKQSCLTFSEWKLISYYTVILLHSLHEQKHKTPQNKPTLRIKEVELNCVRPRSYKRDILGGKRPEKKLSFLVFMICLPKNVRFQYSCEILSPKQLDFVSQWPGRKSCKWQKFLSFKQSEIHAFLRTLNRANVLCLLPLITAMRRCASPD